MAIKTRTSRTSSGVNMERKAARLTQQIKREQSNLDALRDLGRTDLLLKADGKRNRPSKARRTAERAAARAAKAQDK